jgi:hypothetical protein
MRNWSMAFVFDAPSTWTITYRCLTLKSSVVNSHTHSIIPRFSPNPMMTLTSLGGNSTTEVQEACGEHEKGLIHAIDTDGPSAPFLYWHGMDPRIKARAYRFENTSGGPINVWTGLICFNDRTT